MAVHGPHRQHQPRSDFGIRVAPVGEQAQDVELPIREPRRVRPGRRGRPPGHRGAPRAAAAARAPRPQAGSRASSSSTGSAATRSSGSLLNGSARRRSRRGICAARHRAYGSVPLPLGPERHTGGRCPGGSAPSDRPGPFGRRARRGPVRCRNARPAGMPCAGDPQGGSALCSASSAASAMALAAGPTRWHSPTCDGRCSQASSSRSPAPGPPWRACSCPMTVSAAARNGPRALECGSRARSTTRSHWPRSRCSQACSSCR
jgi:hypothetical protein